MTCDCEHSGLGQFGRADGTVMIVLLIGIVPLLSRVTTEFYLIEGIEILCIPQHEPGCREWNGEILPIASWLESRRARDPWVACLVPSDVAYRRADRSDLHP